MQILPEELDEDQADSRPDQTDVNINATQLESEQCIATDHNLVEKAQQQAQKSFLPPLNNRRSIMAHPLTLVAEPKLSTKAGDGKTVQIDEDSLRD